MEFRLKNDASRDECAGDFCEFYRKIASTVSINKTQIHCNFLVICMFCFNAFHLIYIYILLATIFVQMMFSFVSKEEVTIDEKRNANFFFRKFFVFLSPTGIVVDSKECKLHTDKENWNFRSEKKTVVVYILSFWIVLRNKKII